MTLTLSIRYTVQITGSGEMVTLSILDPHSLRGSMSKQLFQLSLDHSRSELCILG